MSFSEAAAERASKKWKDGGPTYIRIFENEHETVDMKSLETQTGKISSKIPSTKEGKGKAGRTTMVRVLFLLILSLEYLILFFSQIEK